MLTSSKVSNATHKDLISIIAWLKCEYAEDAEAGFWCNRSVIENAYRDKSLWVIRRNGEAIAFQTGNYAAEILSVRKDYRTCGMASCLLQASIERVKVANVNVLALECASRTSLGFWKKMSFEEYRNPQKPNSMTVRRILSRTFTLPLKLSLTEVVISFYPEEAQYNSKLDISPIVEHRIKGAWEHSRSVMLEKRVIGLCDDDPEKDLVIKVEVNGVELCFCKAKYTDAQTAGVQSDGTGRTFYIDRVQVTKGNG